MAASQKGTNRSAGASASRAASARRGHAQKPAASARPDRKKSQRKRKRLPLPVRMIQKFFAVLGTTFLSFFLIFVLTGAIVSTALTIYVLNFMEDTTTVTLQEMAISYSTIIYGKNSAGEDVELYSVANEIQRIPIDIEVLPQHVCDAFVCAEDATFYEHEGVNYKSTFAAFANTILKFWDTERGASTITQQLVKNLTGDAEISPERKIREIFRSMQIEKNYTKDEILETYLNYIGFGGSANGIQMAALKYFGKNASELDLAEAACLAAIPKSPESINPFAGYYVQVYNSEKDLWITTDEWVNTGRERNRERMEYVLDQMYKNGVITYDQCQAALAEHLVFTDTEEYKALHPENNPEEVIDEQTATSWIVDTAIYEFADHLVEELDISRSEAISRINKGGYQIYTTADPDMQAYVESVFLDMDNILKGTGVTNNNLAIWEDTDGDGVYSEQEVKYPQAAFTAMDYNGNILAIVGSVGEKTVSLSLNRALEPQQVGSCMKPVSTYGYGVENNLIHWGSSFNDSPLTLPDGTRWPTNYSGGGSGRKLFIYYALQQSYNTVPAQMCNQFGTEEVFNFCTTRLGMDLVAMTESGATDIALSPLSLGALTEGISITNLVNAYQPYGNQGLRTEAHIISRVENGDGTLLYANGTDTKQVVSADTASVMNRLMQNVIENGTGTAAKLSTTDGKKIQITGKTGTTQNWNDLCFVGLNPEFVSGIWFGYDENTEIKYHGISSAKMWRNIIGDYISQNVTTTEFTDSPTVVVGSMCTVSGCIAGPSCPKGMTGYWKQDNAPQCTGHAAVTEDSTAAAE